MLQRELTYITTIAKEKSISKAAEKLFISQPALSLFLNRVEEQVGTQLFDRNGMVLTYAGEKYMHMAGKIQKLYRDFEMELCDIDNQQAGRLKIGTSPHIGSLVLPNVLPEFQKIYPHIEVSISEGTSKTLETMLAKNEIDFSLLHLPMMNTTFQYEVIFKDRYVLAFKKGHPLEKKMYRKQGERFPYLDPRETKHEKFILSFPYQRVRQISDNILNSCHIEPDIVFTSSSVETALLSAAAGMGVTFVPESYIKLFNCEREPNFCYMEERFRAYWTFVIAYSKAGEISKPERTFAKLTKKIFS